ncbi:hypothetical protein D7X55_05540 [Corallococcus sp. AB049A]|uniref:Uncharacterized protein n=1 Tax=Corallococcus interemptor TaxID=2316720 RepID=A0A3A8QT65_9BACT|nr:MULTISPECIES: hypothetical protein [Corallococcus]RKH52981.1 hypothetical protein D7Y23_04855 [Corallococcus sp. AB050B]RKH71999.1 hypothetical protein D7X96_06515 [Corallococcus interemptor]RKI73333.1 hypothetical protein D7X55_05540 [Corallococcus sp. AB049A]
MARLQWGLGLTCLLLGTSAGATHPSIRAKFKTDYREQRFEQLTADDAETREEIPAEGTLEGPFLRLFSEVIQKQNNFKFATWVLCVSPTPEDEGTALLVDSVSRVEMPGKKGHELVVSYRRLKNPDRQSTRKVWPYAVLMAYGWHDRVRCQAAPE